MPLYPLETSAKNSIESLDAYKTFNFIFSIRFSWQKLSIWLYWNLLQMYDLRS